jgi:uncharacterized protein (TIGR03066 family)
MKPLIRLAAILSVLTVAVSGRADEKVPDGLIGTWHSQDAEKHPLVFDKDGTFQYGDEKVDGAWKMRTGTYTIDATGKITGELRLGGAVFRPWYRYKDGVLTGPRGPKPTVTWKKVEKK